MLAGLFLAGLAVAGAGAVYAYEAYLTGVKESKAARLAEAQGSVNSGSVETFVRSRDRFLLSQELLEGHVATSGFLDILERITLENVRYGSLSLLRLADGSAEVSLEGTAKSFNALAAQSAAFSKELKIRRAIFSDIQLDQDGTVSFTLSAEVDPEVFAFALPDDGIVAPPAPVVPDPVAAPAGTSSAATTTP